MSENEANPFELTAVTFDNQHEFAIIKKANGEVQASYVARGRGPFPVDLRYDMRHKLNCMFGKEVRIYWHPDEIISGMKLNNYIIQERLQSLGLTKDQTSNPN